MCGLIGLASPDFQFPPSWLSSACDTLVHRGPDASGEWWSDCGRVGLAHRRLSVLDTSPTGNQPMHLNALGLSIVFNGEIYNYRELRDSLSKQGFKFHSNSDTEVLLASYAQWGVDCLSKLNGMFAFALFDARRQSLFLARDRVGEKPLYYSHSNNRFCFGSELKSLMSIPNSSHYLNHEALDCFLGMGFVPGHHCILQGFYKLPPANAMTFNLVSGELSIWKYWELPNFDESINTSEFDLLNELDELLEDAVGRQLVADVPVGVLLSGGLDSSLVTSMAVRNSADVRTFTVGFPGHGRFDETQHARLVANYFCTNHTELTVESDSADLIPYLAKQLDEPIIDSSILPTFLVSRLVREHCTVALGGDGGDELFAGYNDYSALLRLSKRLKFIPHSMLTAMSRSSRLLPIGFKGRDLLQRLAVNLTYKLPFHSTYFDSCTRKRLLPVLCGEPSYADYIHNNRIPTQTDIIQRSTRMDFENYLAEDVLVKVDRSSMANSLEVRAPLLDYRIIEFAFRKVPSRLKATQNQKKILLKRLASRILPPQFDFHRKQGFSIPLSTWLKKGPYRDLFWDTLNSTDSIFDLKVIHELFSGQNKGYQNSERLFGLVMFEIWRKSYGIKL